MNPAADIFALITLFGLVVVLAGILAVRRFATLPAAAPLARPPITILRPLCGAEPGLDEALDKLAAQSYPDFQIVLGIQDADDPAHDAARRFARRHADREIVVVVDSALHGVNRKISNLINMLPQARHDLLVFSDSDLHVAPDYLDHLAAALETPRTGLATTPCVSRCGQPDARRTAARRLACLHMRHSFLPGALLGHWSGRQDCLGTTMALHRTTLARAGGLAALADQLADDNVLGQLVVALGLRAAIAPTITEATVTEVTLSGLWQHELRWARTIRSLYPLVFASSILHYPLFWAALACLAAPTSPWPYALLAASFATRIAAVRAIDHTLATRFAIVAERRLSRWLLPRDILSVVMVVASYLGTSVVWRGQVLRAAPFRQPEVASPLLS